MNTGLLIDKKSNAEAEYQLQYSIAPNGLAKGSLGERTSHSGVRTKGRKHPLSASYAVTWPDSMK